MRRSVRFTGIGFAIGFLAIQFIPVHRTNALGTGDVEASREVKWILRRACYDCHSLESRWPIWAYVAPMSWRVVADVERARQRLNFSNWTSYEVEQRIGLRAHVGAVTAAHRMPLWYYVTLHPDGRLSDSDRTLLAEWSRHAAEERSPR